jgi:hypothetical protein
MAARKPAAIVLPANCNDGEASRRSTMLRVRYFNTKVRLVTTRVTVTTRPRGQTQANET